MKKRSVTFAQDATKRPLTLNRRMCMACKGKVFFDGDDTAITEVVKEKWGFFVWYKPVFGFTGWYSQDYFGIHYKIE